jgi:tetratricopeptide (TPR) repeat protein
MRDREPKVPITLTDDELERMRPIGLKDGRVAYNDDIMVQHIIQTTEWKRPIYFATSVAGSKWKPYEQYLETQGLEMRLVPRQGNHMLNAFMIERCFDDLYRFRGILTKDGRVDSSIYREKDLNVTLNNYGVAAAELANACGREKDYACAARWTEVALRFAPYLKPANVMLGTYLYLSKDRTAAIEHYRKMIALDPAEPEYRLRLAWIYSESEPELAIRTINEGLDRIPENRQFYIDGFRYAARMGMVDVAKGYIERWLEKHPDDREMRAAFQDIDSVLKADYGASSGAGKK